MSDKRKIIMKSKDGSKELFVDENTLGINWDEHTRLEIDLPQAGKQLGEKIANIDYEKLLKKIKKSSKWLKFGGFLSRIIKK